jgi:hypothetical protein
VQKIVHGIARPFDKGPSTHTISCTNLFTICCQRCLTTTYFEIIFISNVLANERIISWFEFKLYLKSFVDSCMCSRPLIERTFHLAGWINNMHFKMKRWHASRQDYKCLGQIGDQFKQKNSLLNASAGSWMKIKIPQFKKLMCQLGIMGCHGVSYGVRRGVMGCLGVSLGVRGCQGVSRTIWHYGKSQFEQQRAQFIICYAIATHL